MISATGGVRTVTHSRTAAVAVRAEIERMPTADAALSSLVAAL